MELKPRAHLDLSNGCCGCHHIGWRGTALRTGFSSEYVRVPRAEGLPTTSSCCGWCTSKSSKTTGLFELARTSEL
jgi:hypothetical protein